MRNNAKRRQAAPAMGSLRAEQSTLRADEVIQRKSGLSVGAIGTVDTGRTAFVQAMTKRWRDVPAQIRAATHDLERIRAIRIGRRD